MIVAAVLATAMMATRGAAETAPDGTGAAQTAPDGKGAPPTADAADTAAPRPARAPAAHVEEGFMFVPAIGIQSLQGSTGQGAGVGLRAEMLLGARMGENWSLNVGLAFDRLNLDVPSGVSASDYVFDLGFHPLIHFPQEKFEILAGPIVGSFFNKASIGSGAFAIDSWAYGWTIGANLGAMVPVGAKVHLGGLFNFVLRNPLKACVTMGGTDTCGTDNLSSEKVIALAAAAMF
jgi:hypothetical protein